MMLGFQTYVLMTTIYNAVLIDLDRCKRVEGGVLLMNSCRYKKKLGPQEHDWLQLGWLAHWACSDGEYKNNYHEREFDDLDQKYKDDSFLANLIETGELVGLPSSIHGNSNSVCVSSFLLGTYDAGALQSSIIKNFSEKDENVLKHRHT